MSPSNGPSPDDRKRMVDHALRGFKHTEREDSMTTLVKRFDDAVYNASAPIREELGAKGMVRSKHDACNLVAKRLFWELQNFSVDEVRHLLSAFVGTNITHGLPEGGK